MSKSPHAPTANAVIVELLMMCYMCVQVVMPMAVMEETAVLTAPVSTPSWTAMSKSPHAPTAYAVIVEPLLMSHMFLQAPVWTLPAAPATANEMLRPWTAMDELVHARRTDAVLVELSLMAIM